MHIDLCLVCIINFRMKFKYRARVILITIITRGDITGYNVRIITRVDLTVSIIIIIIMMFSRMNFDHI